MNRNMAILFSNATVLPMTAAGNAPRTFAGWVGVDGNRIALVLSLIHISEPTRH